MTAGVERSRFAVVALLVGCGGEANGGPPASPDGGCSGQTPCGGVSGGGGGGTAGSTAGTAGVGGVAGDACSAAPALAWANWPMPHPSGTGLPNPASYDLAEPDVVLDDVTGLMWERAGVEGLSSGEATSRCELLELGGHCDWRVPTRIELVSLVDFTRSSPALDPDAFPTADGEFLSSSVHSGYRWRIGSDGATRSLTDGMAPTGWVRCVRRAEARAVPEPRYTISGQAPNDTVTDRSTGLVWQRQLSTATYTFDEAQAYCAGLSLDGGGFRAPSMKELQTLLDETRTTPPLIDEATFPGYPETVNPTFWTSSASVRSTDNAWFSRGAVTIDSAVDASKSAKFYIRCVR